MALAGLSKSRRVRLDELEVSHISPLNPGLQSHVKPVLVEWVSRHKPLFSQGLSSSCVPHVLHRTIPTISEVSRTDPKSIKPFPISI